MSGKKLSDQLSQNYATKCSKSINIYLITIIRELENDMVIMRKFLKIRIELIFLFVNAQ